MERAVIKSAGSSPHTRGAHFSPIHGARAARIIPAYAGSTGWRRRRGRSGRDHPRIRGEHVPIALIATALAGSSPHTRGARWRRTGRRPRRCGSSPHTRGARRLGLGRRQTGRIIPAYAGSTRSGTSNSASTRDHPRIRGEHQRRQRRREAGAGSSPHTRGAHRRQHWDGYRLGIIPAYAGSTSNPVSALLKTADHPRIRGEHVPASFGSEGWGGSSPHTRGALCMHHRHRARRRIIPAYAGSTPSTRISGFSRRDHPRIRGEHERLQLLREFGEGSSPHTRGAPGDCAPHHSIRPDHPRIRGEHRRYRRLLSWKVGSSPHTRGALDREAVRARIDGIIPAYAGSTCDAGRRRFA